MAWFRCLNCRDYSLGLIGQFKEFEADGPLCPHCGTSDNARVVIQLVPVHLLLPDPRGPILGAGGRRLKVGCMPARDHLATGEEGETFSASGDPRAVTCPSCKGLPAWRERANLFPELKHQLIIEEAAKGCC
jgi:hypothetical protein